MLTEKHFRRSDKILAPTCLAEYIIPKSGTRQVFLFRERSLWEISK